MRLYFEQANFGKYIAWCDNWCVLVEAEDVGTALGAVYLQRHEQLIDDGDDGLLTCSVCSDRYTTSPSGVCDHCRHQQWLDDNA